MRGGRRALGVALCAGALSSMLLGCGTGATHYQPRLVARGELTMRYHDGFELWAAGRPVAYGHHYSDLPEIVRCVPKAYEHARAAKYDGYVGTTLSTMGIIFGLGSLGGLGGLAYYESDEKLMAAFFAAGIGSGILGVVLSGISRGYKNSANGHAVDAMNYYNDAVGSWGASCNDLVYPPPAGPEPPQSPPGRYVPGAEGEDPSGTPPPPPPPSKDEAAPEEEQQKAPPPPPPPSGDAIPIR